MTKREKEILIKKIDRAESLFWKAESQVSELGNHVQQFFDEEIIVCMSSDGAMITNDNGEIQTVKDFISGI
tara:strand:- start:348 stop:560 length:213 start_codon:yes stop_codon:yes gene_type:complete